MKKCLAIFKDDQILEGLAKELQIMTDHSVEQARFLHKKLEQLQKDATKNKVPVWDKIGERLVELKRLDHYDKKKTNLELDREQGIILLCDDKDDGPGDMNGFLKALFKRITE